MKITYQTHFAPKRSDGRAITSFAAFRARLQMHTPPLALPKTLTRESFLAWQTQVKEKVTELLRMPPKAEPRQALCVSVEQRDGYTAQRWEIYPDEYSVVPLLMLVPDTATAATPAPAVLCIPGSTYSKEFLAGEPLLDRPVCRCEKYPERNRIALHMVKNGMVALAFDHPEIAERALDIDREDDHGSTGRESLCYGLLQFGWCYDGISVYEKLCALELVKTLDFVAQDKIAVAAHSLGTMPALYLGLLCDEVKAVVFNDYIADPREQFTAITECDEEAMPWNSGNWHITPGLWYWFSHQDLLAALAPKFLATNEGGASQYVDTVRRAYEALGVAEHYQHSHYPKYADRVRTPDLEKQGYSQQSYFDAIGVDAPDHSFRAAPSLALLAKCFKREKTV